MAESTQKKLGRVRPPRVQITYDVEIGDAIQKKELPFVMGVIADLSGKPEEPLPPMKERKFVFIDRDNFDEVMASYKPRLAFQAENKLLDDGSKLNVALNFNSIEDFEPINVVQQVPALSKLFEARKRLSDLLTKLDGNDDLDAILQEALANTEQLAELKPEETDEPEEAAEAGAEGKEGGE